MSGVRGTVIGESPSAAKAGIENVAVIAAVNRCATQRRVKIRSSAAPPKGESKSGLPLLYQKARRNRSSIAPPKSETKSVFHCATKKRDEIQVSATFDEGVRFMKAWASHHEDASTPRSHAVICILRRGRLRGGISRNRGRGRGRRSRRSGWRICRWVRRKAVWLRL
jgi:hypothetical protein